MTLYGKRRPVLPIWVPYTPLTFNLFHPRQLSSFCTRLEAEQEEEEEKEDDDDDDEFAN